MKILICIAAVAVVAVGCRTKEQVNLKNGSDSLSYFIGVYTALKLKDAGYQELDYSKFEYALTKAFKSKNASELITSDSIITYYFKKAKAQEFSLTLKAGENFLAQNSKRKEISTTTSGLQYEIFKKGEGRRAVINDSVVFHYTAITTEGVEFINSYKNNAPVRMLLKEGTPGGLEAFQIMHEESHYRFYIPARLAYGNRSDPAGIIKPYSSIIYTIELIEVIPSSKRL